jgi:hypothetical protein
MKQKPTPMKSFKIEMESYFSTPSELVQAIDKIRHNIIRGNLWMNNIGTKYQILNLKEPDFRFEEHDGKQYAVFQSKMNQDGTV